MWEEGEEEGVEDDAFHDEAGWGEEDEEEWGGEEDESDGEEWYPEEGWEQGEEEHLEEDPEEESVPERQWHTGPKPHYVFRRPEEVRFSQSTIKQTFQNDVTLDETLGQLASKCTPKRAVTMIRAVRHEGHL